MVIGLLKLHLLFIRNKFVSEIFELFLGKFVLPSQLTYTALELSVFPPKLFDLLLKFN